MFCRICGKEIHDEAVICPSCGCQVKETAATTSQPEKEQKKANILCIIGFVLSLVSLIIALYGVVAIAGLVLSIIGVVQTNKKGERLKGLGIAGICISAASLVYTIYVLVVLASLLSAL